MERCSLTPREMLEIQRVKDQTRQYIAECKEHGFNLRAESLETMLEHASDAALNAFIGIAKGFF